MPTVVWFKKDLRVADHTPLRLAAERGAIIPLFIYEPSILHSPEFDGQHLRFLNECLTDLDAALRTMGGRLVTRIGEAVEVLEVLRTEAPFDELLSHEETGNALSYQRDKAVAKWARESGVRWMEIPQTGVVRRLRDRNGWSRLWEQRMAEPLVLPPERLGVPQDLASVGILDPHELGVEKTAKAHEQHGGEQAARRNLDDFLNARGVGYAKGLSSPVTAPQACSRISAHLAFGCLSMRQVRHALNDRREALRHTPNTIDRRWWGSLKAFEARLHWHCHFMQKLESEPRIEFENLHRACDGLREDAFNEERFAAWCSGQTGYPMVDACMRSLLATGWLNFRMRAMLVSFASYDLWLHWRRPAIFLAQHFLDFEPGIHFSQFQMQSGTTGINTLRMYSPTKQGLDHDPSGGFIRRWVPELEGVPASSVHEPWLMTLAEQDRFGCRIGVDYPAPVVDHKAAVAFAKEKLYALRRGAEARAESRSIVKAHGSRKKPGEPSPRRQRKKDVTPDLFQSMEGFTDAS